MRNKVDTWVLFRVDSTLLPEDGIIVKAVYDSQEDANVALDRASAENPHAKYMLVRSRRFTAEVDFPSLPRTRFIQGFPPSESTGPTPPRIDAVRGLLNSLTDFPESTKRRACLPVLGLVVEEAVAKALGGKLTENTPWDISLADGQRIECKVVLLSEERSRAPSVELPALPEFDTLALVVFAADLNVEMSILIDVESLGFIATVNPKYSEYSRRAMRFRVTPHLRHAPGVHHLEIVPFL